MTSDVYQAVYGEVRSAQEDLQVRRIERALEKQLGRKPDAEEFRSLLLEYLDLPERGEELSVLDFFHWLEHEREHMTIWR